MTNMKERWIDVAKCLAIMAVMLDHVNGYLYTDQAIAYISYYSTGLFILIMGVTTYWTFSNSKVLIWKKVVERIKNMIIPYAIAVVLYYCVIFKAFNLLDYLHYVVSFNISGSHYYVLLFLQLIIVSPMLVYFLKKPKSHNVILNTCFELMFGGVRCKRLFLI